MVDSEREHSVRLMELQQKYMSTQAELLQAQQDLCRASSSRWRGEWDIVMAKSKTSLACRPARSTCGAAGAAASNSFRLESGTVLLYWLGSVGSVEWVRVSSRYSGSILNEFAAAAPQTLTASRLHFSIIIIIKYIYIAQDREEAANALGNSYKWNRNVLSLFLNVASVMSGVRNSAGRLFHT